MQNYIQTHYTAPRMVIVAFGAVKHEDIVEQAKSLFTKLSTDPTTVSEELCRANFVHVNIPKSTLLQFIRFINDIWCSTNFVKLILPGLYEAIFVRCFANCFHCFTWLKKIIY